ncbi:MAG: divalent-cation tolerance protein CutA [Myxococcales bacterium]|nr:divalent-cation tolerance protein CutA [Myxococcales bacterium]
MTGEPPRAPTTGHPPRDDADAPLVVLCTAPGPEEAGALARGLVDTRLAACVQIVPNVRSIYRFEGVVHDEPEAQLVIKTRRGRYAALEAWLVEHHPYAVPELLALPVERGLEAYVSWLCAET